MHALIGVATQHNKTKQNRIGEKDRGLELQSGSFTLPRRKTLLITTHRYRHYQNYPLHLNAFYTFSPSSVTRALINLTSFLPKNSPRF